MVGHGVKIHRQAIIKRKKNDRVEYIVKEIDVFKESSVSFLFLSFSFRLLYFTGGGWVRPCWKQRLNRGAAQPRWVGAWWITITGCFASRKSIVYTFNLFACICRFPPNSSSPSLCGTQVTRLSRSFTRYLRNEFSFRCSFATFFYFCAAGIRRRGGGEGRRNNRMDK